MFNSGTENTRVFILINQTFMCSNKLHHWYRFPANANDGNAGSSSRSYEDVLTQCMFSYLFFESCCNEPQRMFSSLTTPIKLLLFTIHCMFTTMARRSYRRVCFPHKDFTWAGRQSIFSIFRNDAPISFCLYFYNIQLYSFIIVYSLFLLYLITFSSLMSNWVSLTQLVSQIKYVCIGCP